MFSHVLCPKIACAGIVQLFSLKHFSFHFGFQTRHASFPYTSYDYSRPLSWRIPCNGPKQMTSITRGRNWLIMYLISCWKTLILHLQMNMSYVLAQKLDYLETTCFRPFSLTIEQKLFRVCCHCYFKNHIIDTHPLVKCSLGLGLQCKWHKTWAAGFTLCLHTEILDTFSECKWVPAFARLGTVAQTCVTGLTSSALSPHSL